MKTDLTPPMQPIIDDTHNVKRFKENKIVTDLLAFATAKGMGMNEIALGEYAKEDRRQFAQLIGYSLSGYSELRSYVDEDACGIAYSRAYGPKKKTAVEVERDYYRDELEALRKALRKPVAKLFGIHPDNLGGAS